MNLALHTFAKDDVLLFRALNIHHEFTVDGRGDHCQFWMGSAQAISSMSRAWDQCHSRSSHVRRRGIMFDFIMGLKGHR